MTKERGHPMLPADVSASAHSLAANDTVPTPPVLTTPLLVNSSTAALASAAVASVAALVNDTTRNASVAIANNSLRLIQSIDDPKTPKGAEGDIIDDHTEKQNVILLVFVIAALPVLLVSACCCVQPRMPWSSAEPKKTDQ